MTTALDKTLLRKVALEHKEEISEKLFNYFLDMLEAYQEENGAKINKKGNVVIDRNEDDLYERVTQILFEIGIPANLKGFRYLRDAMILCYHDTDFIYGTVTKKLYPKIATMNNTTSSRVERAIRHAITVIFSRGNLEMINEYFAYTINRNTGYLSNSEFIFTIVDKLQRENSMQKRNV